VEIGNCDNMESNRMYVCDEPISSKYETETDAGKEQIITIQNTAGWGIINPLKVSDNTNYKY